MTSPRAFRIVDVFGSDPFTGNPVAVVHDADGLSTEQMQRISAWTNLSECTFLVAPTDDGADYRVRIFCLDRELPFAGHPTLGTARAWLDAGGVPRDPGCVVQECGVGPVRVRIDGDLLAFAAPPLVRSGPLDEATSSLVLRVLRVTADDVVDTAWIDNGPGWVGVLLRDVDAVLAVDAEANGEDRDLVLDIGVLGLRPEGDETALELRAFFSDPTGALREDPVTGSLNASAAQWMLSSGRLTAPYTASQGTRVGRRGRVLIDEDDGAVWVGGRTDVAVLGALSTPPG